MATRQCWQCNAHAHMTFRDTPRRAKTGTWWQPANCDNCGALSIAQTNELKLEIKPRYGGYEDHKKEKFASATLVWYPEHILGKEFPDVPTQIASAASEAYACYSIRSYRAAIILARAVIEALAKDQGANGRTLAAKIDQLEQKRIIKPASKETAHEIRYIGNDMAHGDFIDEVTEEEADDVLNFMTTLLEEVYQQPAALSRFREARLRRNEQGRN